MSGGVGMNGMEWRSVEARGGDGDEIWNIYRVEDRWAGLIRLNSFIWGGGSRFQMDDLPFQLKLYM